MEIGDHSLHDVIAVSRRNDNLGGSYQSVHIPAVEIFDPGIIGMTEGIVKT